MGEGPITHGAAAAKLSRPQPPLLLLVTDIVAIGPLSAWCSITWRQHSEDRPNSSAAY